MGPAGFFIALLGCADGSVACAPVATFPIRYESREACSAATGRVLAANTDFDFPTVMAECRASKSPVSGSSQPTKSELSGSRRT